MQNKCDESWLQLPQCYVPAQRLRKTKQQKTENKWTKTSNSDWSKWPKMQRFPVSVKRPYCCDVLTRRASSRDARSSPTSFPVARETMGTRLAPAKKGSEHLVPGPISSLTPYARRQSLITGIIHCNTSLFVKKKRKEKKRRCLLHRLYKHCQCPLLPNSLQRAHFEVRLVTALALLPSFRLNILISMSLILT